MENLLNLIFISKCTLCNKEVGNLICNKCLAECRFIYSTNCIFCDNPSTLGITHISCIKRAKKGLPISSFGVFEYYACVRECIVNAKYSKQQFMALKILIRFGMQNCQINGLAFDPHLIAIPIPLSRKKQKKRGFNQAEIICKEVGKTFGLATASELLIRSRDTPHQHAKTRSQRFENLFNAFSINKRYTQMIPGKKFLLVDDIWTTGATLTEAANVLYKAGAEEVQCFALSKKEKMLKSKYDKSNLSAHTDRAPATVAQKP